MALQLKKGPRQAIYIMLSHPLSPVRKQLDFLTPQPNTSQGIKQAATDVANLVNTMMKLNLPVDSGDPQKPDLTKLVADIQFAKLIVPDSSNTKVRMTSDPVLLAALDDYDPNSGCPTSDEGNTFFTNLP